MRFWERLLVIAPLLGVLVLAGTRRLGMDRLTTEQAAEALLTFIVWWCLWVASIQYLFRRTQGGADGKDR